MVELQCTCGQIMNLDVKDETDDGKVRNEYSCQCGNKGLVLEYPDRPADFFIKDENGNTLRYDQMDEE